MKKLFVTAIIASTLMTGQAFAAGHHKHHAEKCVAKAHGAKHKAHHPSATKKQHKANKRKHAGKPKAHAKRCPHKKVAN